MFCLISRVCCAGLSADWVYVSPVWSVDALLTLIRALSVAPVAAAKEPTAAEKQASITNPADEAARHKPRLTIHGLPPQWTQKKYLRCAGECGVCALCVVCAVWYIVCAVMLPVCCVVLRAACVVCCVPSCVLSVPWFRDAPN